MADQTTIQAIRDDDPVKRFQRRALLRFFSVESDINMATNLPTSSTPKYHFRSKEFFLKIAQLLTGVICVGMYAEGVNVTTESLTFVCFPTVVFSSYIIINSVIIISYMFGQVMTDILIRVFVIIGMILYFISATISTTIWCSTIVTQPELHLAKTLFFVQAILSYLNCLLYGLDLFFNIKKAVKCDI